MTYTDFDHFSTTWLTNQNQFYQKQTYFFRNLRTSPFRWSVSEVALRLLAKVRPPLKKNIPQKISQKLKKKFFHIFFWHVSLKENDLHVLSYRSKSFWPKLFIGLLRYRLSYVKIPIFIFLNRVVEPVTKKSSRLDLSYF